MADRNSSPQGPIRYRLGLASAAALGVLLAGVVDLFLSKLLLQSSALSFTTTALVAGHFSAAAMVTAVLVLTLACCGPRQWRALHPGVWLGVAVVAAVVIWLNAETFSGPRITQHQHRDLIVLSFRLGVPLLLLIGSLVLRAIVKKQRILAALICLGTTAVCFYAHLTIMRGLYPGFHKSAVFLGIAASASFGMIWLARFRSALILASGLVVLALGMSLFVRTTAEFRQASASLKDVGASAAEIATWTEKSFRSLIPVQVITAESVSLDADDPEVLRKVATALDGLVAGRRNMSVIYLAIDTLRADRVGWAGYRRPTTPNLDALAKKSWTFTNAITPYPTSAWTYASVFAGRYPRATSCYDAFFGSEGSEKSKETLPAVLSNQGWRTIAVNAFNEAGNTTRREFGTLMDGFEVANPHQRQEAMTGDQVLESALQSLGQGDDRPFFMWMHFLEPHDPYEIHEGFEFGPERQDAYDSEIAYCDNLVGQLLAALKERGLDQSTAIVVFSDHGEEFGEHGGRFHNSNLYSPQIRVPLMIHVPGLQPAKPVVDSTVSLVDLCQTTTMLLGVEDPFDRQGRNLWPLMLDAEQSPPGVAYAEHYFMFAGQMERNPRCVIEGSNKLIWNRVRNDWEMYDLAKDPQEKNSLIGKDDALESRLKGLLNAFDERIDSGAKTIDMEARRAEFMALVNEKIAVMLGDDHPAGYQAESALDKILFDYLGDPSPDLRALLGENGLDQIALDIATKAEELKGGGRGRAIHFLAFMAQPSTRDFLLTEVKRRSGYTVQVAVALARLGDPIGLPALEYALDSKGYDKRQVAVGLGFLRDPRSYPMLMSTVMGLGNVDYMGRGFEALGKLGDPRTARAMRPFVAESYWKAKPLLRKIAQVVVGLPKDDHLFWLVARLCVDEDPLVSDAAKAALHELGFEERLSDELREAFILERDGDVAIYNRKMELGVSVLQEALEIFAKQPGVLGFNAPLRLRMARYLQFLNRGAEAQAILEFVAANAPEEDDRITAKRRILMLGFSPRILDAAEFGAEVVKIEMPEPVRKFYTFPCRVILKNTGAAPWQGGYWLHANAIHFGWEDESGQMMRIAPNDIPFFVPEGGVMPGETLTVESLFPAPYFDGTETEARPVIIFEQPWLTLPDGGIIHRGDHLVSVEVNLL